MNSSTGWPGLDEHHHPARLLELFAHLGDGMGTENLGSLGFLGQKLVNLLDRAVVGHDGEAVVVHIEDDVLAHDGQADECNVALWLHVLSGVRVWRDI